MSSIVSGKLRSSTNLIFKKKSSAIYKVVKKIIICEALLSLTSNKAARGIF